MYLQNTLLTQPAQRIVSLVPSITELLHHFQLEDETVGITKFCEHPATWFHSKKRIGGTKQIHVDEVRNLQPDLIIANKEENVKVQVDALAALYPVWLTDVETVEDALQMILDIGELTAKPLIAQTLIESIKQSMQEPILPMIPSVYLIWKEPYMTVGSDTFIHHMMHKAGFSNCFDHQKRYPEVNEDDIINCGAEWLLLSSEPYPFQQKHLEELKATFPHQQIALVDGTYFSWYGSRMADAFKYFSLLRKDMNIDF